MSETDDRIVKLLEEIRDNQATQAERASEYTDHVKKIHEAYAAQLEKYQGSQDAFKQSQDQYQKELPKRSVAVAIFLGIIALGMVINIVLRLMGKQEDAEPAPARYRRGPPKREGYRSVQ